MTDTTYDGTHNILSKANLAAIPCLLSKARATAAFPPHTSPPICPPTRAADRTTTPPSMTTFAVAETPRADRVHRHVVRLSDALAALLARVCRAEGVVLWEDKVLSRLRAKGLMSYAEPPGDGHRAPVAAAESGPVRHVVRLSEALAALVETSWELWEDELLGRLRAKGLITYLTPLIGRLVEELRDVFAAEVLPQLDPTDLAMLGRARGARRAAVVASGLPRAGATVGLPLQLRQFVGSVEWLGWAKASDCPWVARTCELAAAGGHLEVLVWAREHGCPWEENIDNWKRAAVNSPLRAGTWRC